MRTFKFSRTIALMAIVSLITFSCSNDQEIATINTDEISEDVKAQFESLGFDVSDIKKTDDLDLLDPEQEGGNYLLEGDIVITPENLEKMLVSNLFHVGAVGEQYRTNNLVSVNGSRTIRVIGFTGGSNALTSKMRTALQWSVNNYNALNMGLNFTLDFGTNWQAYDIVVYRVSGSGGGGSAGFPSGGDPYQFVQILTGTDNFSTNVNEHVITHEIGHCLGLRHTDYFNRSLSCGYRRK